MKYKSHSQGTVDICYFHTHSTSKNFCIHSSKEPKRKIGFYIFRFAVFDTTFRSDIWTKNKFTLIVNFRSLAFNIYSMQENRACVQVFFCKYTFSISIPSRLTRYNSNPRISRISAWLIAQFEHFLTQLALQLSVLFKICTSSFTPQIIKQSDPDRNEM